MRRFRHITKNKNRPMWADAHIEPVIGKSRYQLLVPWGLTQMDIKIYCDNSSTAGDHVIKKHKKRFLT